MLPWCKKKKQLLLSLVDLVVTGSLVPFLKDTKKDKKKKNVVFTV